MVSRKVPEEVPKQIELCTCMDGGWKSDLGPVQMVPELWRTWRRDGAAWPLSCLHQALLQSSLSLLLGDMLSTCSTEEDSEDALQGLALRCPQLSFIAPSHPGWTLRKC
jgi:hypothetical protein